MSKEIWVGEFDNGVTLVYDSSIQLPDCRPHLFLWKPESEEMGKYIAEIVRERIKPIKDQRVASQHIKAYEQWYESEDAAWLRKENPYCATRQASLANEEWRKATLNREKVIENSFMRREVQCLWYITHRDNIPSILERGILNHHDAGELSVKCVDISNPDVQRRRNRDEPHYHRKIHDYAPLYINPKNPMLSVQRDMQDELCLIEVFLSVMFENQYLITDGNAASQPTQFFNSVSHIAKLPWDVLNAKYWGDLEEGRRKRCAEVLIYPKVTPKHIKSVHCYSQNTLNALANCGCKIQQSSDRFF